MHLRRINARKVSTSFSTQTVRDSTLVCEVISIHVKRKRNVWTLSGKPQRHSVANRNFHLGYHHDNWPNLLTSCGRCINYLKWPLRCDHFRCEQTRLRVWPHKATTRASGQTQQLVLVGLGYSAFRTRWWTRFGITKTKLLWFLRILFDPIKWPEHLLTWWFAYTTLSVVKTLVSERPQLFIP